MRACKDASIVFTVVAAGCLLFAACDKKPEQQAKASCPTCVTADEHGFTPPSLDLPKGPPGSKVALTFTRTTEKTCAKEAVFPDLKLNVPLPLNTPVTIEVPNDSERTLTFACGMDMYKGKVVVK